MFDPSASNPRAASVRIQCDQAARAAGQRKHDLRNAPIPAYVDKDRMHLNSVILEPLTGPKLRKICEDRRAMRTTQRAMKSNASVAMSGIIVFGRDVQADFDALTVERQNEAYIAVAEAIAKRLKTTVTGLVAHRDESAPHAHFQFPAYDVNGNALSMTTKRAVTSELQTITAQVMKRFVKRVERGNSKYERLKAGAEYADTVHRSVAELHNDLAPEIAAAKETLADLHAQAEKQAERVAKLEALEELTGKKAKLLKTYKRRLKDKKAALSETQNEIDRLEATITEEQSHVDDARRIADEEWGRANDAFDARIKAEEQIEALAADAEKMKLVAEQKAQEAADALLADAKKEASENIRRFTEETSQRLEKTLLTDGQQALLKAERERKHFEGAFNLLKKVLQELVPNLFDKIATRWNELWKAHPDNLGNKPTPRPPSASGPSGP